MIEVATPGTGSADIVKNLGLETYLDYLAVRLNHPEAAKTEIALNFVMPDVDQRFALMVENGVMNYTLGSQLDSPQATVTIDRAVLDAINLGQKKLEAAIADGTVIIDGDASKVEEFIGLLDSFEFWFNIVTPQCKFGCSLLPPWSFAKPRRQLPGLLRLPTKPREEEQPQIAVDVEFVGNNSISHT